MRKMSSKPRTQNVFGGVGWKPNNFNKHINPKDKKLG